VNAATIRVRVPSGALRTFDAESVTIDCGLVTAAGYWRHCPERGRHTYVWPRRQLVSMRGIHVADPVHRTREATRVA